MKILFFILIITISFPACNLYYGVNYQNNKKIKNLQIGMTKDEAIQIMGTDYSIESVSEEQDGILEIWKYDSVYNFPYLLHFLDGKLVFFNKFYPPVIPQQNITISHDEK